MFTRDSKILSHRLTTPLTAVANAVGDVFKPTYNQLIKSLFANNEQGFAYNPNDLTTMFQDAAGTIPVTGAGQPVGLILDKSGRNNHAYQTTSASRPILRQNATTGAYYLEFDGTDDFLETADVPSLNESTVISGTRLRRTSGAHPIVAKGVGSYPYLSGSMFFIQMVGDLVRIANNTNGDIQLAQYFLNGSNYIETQQGSLSSGAVGNGLKTSGKFFIARFNAASTATSAAYDLYGLVVIGKVLPANQYKEVTNYLKNKMGI